MVQNGIQTERELRDDGKSSVLEIFKGVNWRRTLAGCVGICSQWAAGAPIVFGYSTVSIPVPIFFFKSTGLTNVQYFFQVAGLADPFLVSVLTFVILIVAIVASLLSCEYIGRRPLLIG